jgi:hypothetical protein
MGERTREREEERLPEGGSHFPKGEIVCPPPPKPPPYIGGGEGVVWAPQTLKRVASWDTRGPCAPLPQPKTLAAPHKPMLGVGRPLNGVPSGRGQLRWAAPLLLK